MHMLYTLWNVCCEMFLAPGAPHPHVWCVFHDFFLPVVRKHRIWFRNMAAIFEKGSSMEKPRLDIEAARNQISEPHLSRWPPLKTTDLIIFHQNFTFIERSCQKCIVQIWRARAKEERLSPRFKVTLVSTSAHASLVLNNVFYACIFVDGQPV